MSILSVDQIQPIGSGTTITLNATEIKTGTEITVGTGASIFSPAGNTLTFGTNNVERLRITSTGNIGVGSAIPSAKFVVSNDGANGFEFNPNFNSNNSIIASYNRSGGGSYSQLTLSASQHIFAQGGTEYGRFDASGRLLIGTTTEGHADADDFTIGTSTNSAGITIRTNTSGTGRLWFSDGTSGDTEYRGYIQYDHNNERLTLGSGGSTRVTIDNSGRVLIGTLSAINTSSSKFQVASNDANGSAILARFSANNYSSYLDFYKSRNATLGSETIVNSGDHLGAVRFYGCDGSGYTSAAEIYGTSDGGTADGDMPGRITFHTRSDGAGQSMQERLRIASNGMITLGNPSNSVLKAEINNSVGGHYFVSQCNDNSNGFEIYQQHGATHTRAPFAVYDNKTGSKDLSFKIDGAGWAYFNTTSNGTTNGSVDKRYNIGSTSNANVAFQLTTRQKYSIWEHRQIGRTHPRTAQMACGEAGNQGTVVMYSSTANSDVTGGVNLTNGATSWSANSDMRLKNKTGDILNALEDINKIEPLRFTWKYGPDNNPHVGVSAQSVENIVPEAIDRGVDVERQREGDETLYMRVRYTELIPLSIAAIKELKAEVESLKAEIASLKSS